MKLKSFLCSFVLACLVGMPANAACPEGHISCEEAARLNGAAGIMSVMTDTASLVILTCEEEATS